MNKAEFLDTLRGRIDMLEDAEISDILSEYSLHIECKVKCGMSEEEAVADFGDVGELAADILSAYHVKAPAEIASSIACENAGSVANAGEAASSASKEAGASGIPCSSSASDPSAPSDSSDAKSVPGVFVVDASGAVSAASRGWNAVKSGVSRVFAAIGRGFRGFCDGCAHLCERMWSKVTGKGGADAAPAVVAAPATAAASPAADAASAVVAVPADASTRPGFSLFQKLASLWRKFWLLVVRVARACWRLCLWAVKWCLVLCVGFAVLMCAFAAVALIFAFGASAVMAALGYPFWGASLVLLGVSASAAALTLLGFNLLRWHVLPWGKCGGKSAAQGDENLMASSVATEPMRLKGKEAYHA